MKKTIILIIAILIIIGLVVLYKQHGTLVSTSQKGSLNVVASTYPLAEIARTVGGHYVNVTLLTPGGAEPHDYEPTPADIETLYKAQLVVVNGAGMEIWLDKIKSDLQKQGAKILNITESLPSSGLIADSQGHLDPHVWLNPHLFEQEINLVRDELSALDPSHRNVYLQNAAGYSARIAELETRYTEGLRTCTQTDFVTSHNAFEYLAMQYHLTSHTIAGFSPDSEPSPRALADLTNTLRTQKIKYVFFETLASPKLAQTLAEEAHAQTLVLNPIEGLTAEDTKAGETYGSLMEKNLTNLRTALACK